MAKKTTKEYSLEDYICGMSRDEFEENQLKLVEAKNYEYTERDTGCGFNLLREMNKIYKSVFVAEFQSKKYLYYKRLDDLVIKAKGGNREATLEIMAYALHSWNPNAMVQKFHMWNGNTDSDDVTQVICLSVLSAIQTFKIEENCFKNFAGYLKAWVIGDLKSAQIDSAPIKSAGSAIVENDNGEQEQVAKNNSGSKISYLYIDGFKLDDEESRIEIPDPSNEYEQFEDVELDKEFVNSIKSWPDRIGDVVLTYYGIAAEDCQKTLQATAETLGMTVKQVRSRLEKGRKIIKEMYSEYSDYSDIAA